MVLLMETENADISGSQLVLFGGAPVRTRLEANSNFSQWSHSRRELMNQCLSSYYNKYYGAHSTFAKSEPRKLQLRFLKSLSNRYQRSGKILHLVISSYINHAKEGDYWSIDRTIRWARELFRADISYSCDFMNRYGIGRYDVSATDDQSGVGKQPSLLAEFYYNRDAAEALCKLEENRMVNALQNFVSHENLEWFRRGAFSDDSLIEARLSLTDEHFHLIGRLDSAFREDGRHVIIDWKIGTAGGGEDDLQLFAYSLPAIKEFQCEPEDIDLYKVFLTSAGFAKYTFSKKAVMRTKARIIQDVERMRFLDPYGRDGIASAFTPCRRPRVCANCVFREVCPSADQ